MDRTPLVLRTPLALRTPRGTDAADRARTEVSPAARPPTPPCPADADPAGGPRTRTPIYAQLVREWRARGRAVPGAPDPWRTPPERLPAGPDDVTAGA
ncbi:hypothetical protein WN71_024575 [Streptomyces mangrovisoli]|uniref:Uncharacterized protein n=1 Tax=Streptomyces mangrovisoli TaxID=1428628 RepID=A0A1J4NSF3_9ACTN|nr:hypothetical protein WN71_024575 [Streptomyces mangrovisoli]